MINPPFPPSFIPAAFVANEVGWRWLRANPSTYGNCPTLPSSHFALGFSSSVSQKDNLRSSCSSGTASDFLRLSNLIYSVTQSLLVPQLIHTLCKAWKVIRNSPAVMSHTLKKKKPTLNSQNYHSAPDLKPAVVTGVHVLQFWPRGQFN